MWRLIKQTDYIPTACIYISSSTFSCCSLLLLSSCFRRGRGCDKISPCEPVVAHLLGWAPSFSLKLIICTIRRTASLCNYHAAYQKGYETMGLWVRRLDILSRCQMPVWGAMWESCYVRQTGGKYYDQTPVIWITLHVIKFISLAKIFNTSYRQ